MKYQKSDMIDIKDIQIGTKMKYQKFDTIDIKDIQERLLHGKNRIQQILNENLKNKLIILLGNSGVGKTTLAKYLTEDIQLNVVKNEYDQLEIIGKDIGNTLVSETSLPNYYKNDQMAILDCPGFRDNRSVTIEIINAFYIKEIFENCNKLEVCYLIKQDSLMETRVEGFLDDIRTIESLFQDKLDFKSITLVITKVTDQTPKSLAAKIKKISSTKELNLNDTTHSLLNHLSDNLVTFHNPKVEGLLPLNDKEIILSAINKFDLVKTGKVNLAISDKTKNWIMNASLVIVEEVKNLLNKEVEDFNNYVKDTYSYNSNTDIPVVKIQLINIIDHIRKLQTYNLNKKITINFPEVLNNLFQVGQFNVTIFEELNPKILCLEFFNQVSGKTKYLGIVENLGRIQEIIKATLKDTQDNLIQSIKKDTELKMSEYFLELAQDIITKITSLNQDNNKLTQITDLYKKLKSILSITQNSASLNQSNNLSIIEKFVTDLKNEIVETYNIKTNSIERLFAIIQTYDFLKQVDNKIFISEKVIITRFDCVILQSKEILQQVVDKYMDKISVTMNIILEGIRPLPSDTMSSEMLPPLQKIKKSLEVWHTLRDITNSLSNQKYCDEQAQKTINAMLPEHSKTFSKVIATYDGCKRLIHVLNVLETLKTKKLAVYNDSKILSNILDIVKELLNFIQNTSEDFAQIKTSHLDNPITKINEHTKTALELYKISCEKYDISTKNKIQTELSNLKNNLKVTGCSDKNILSILECLKNNKALSDKQKELLGLNVTKYNELKELIDEYNSFYKQNDERQIFTHENQLNDILDANFPKKHAKTNCECKCEIFVVKDIIYDNELLNHPDILKISIEKLGLSTVLDRSTYLSPDLVSQAISQHNDELLLAGLISLENTYDI